MIHLSLKNPELYSDEERANLISYLSFAKRQGQIGYIYTEHLAFEGKGLLDVICPVRDGKRELVVVIHKLNNFSIELPYSEMNEEEKRKSVMNNDFTKGLFPLNENNVSLYKDKYDFSEEGLNIFATGKLTAKKASSDYVLPRYTEAQLSKMLKADLTALAESIGYERRTGDKWIATDKNDLMEAKLYVLIGFEIV